jgi:hypothetical protein
MVLDKHKVTAQKQIERQGKVGIGLDRLKIERDEIDKVLVETIEFNERILNPSSWQAKIRERNRRDMQNHQEKRMI